MIDVQRETARLGALRRIASGKTVSEVEVYGECYVTIKQAAKECGVNQWTFRDILRRERWVTTIKLGNLTLVRRKDLYTL